MFVTDKRYSMDDVCALANIIGSDKGFSPVAFYDKVASITACKVLSLVETQEMIATAMEHHKGQEEYGFELEKGREPKLACVRLVYEVDVTVPLGWVAEGNLPMLHGETELQAEHFTNVGNLVLSEFMDNLGSCGEEQFLSQASMSLRAFAMIEPERGSIIDMKV